MSLKLPGGIGPLAQASRQVRVEVAESGSPLLAWEMPQFWGAKPA